MTTADEFWASVDRSGGPNVCWPWLRGSNPTTYGFVKWRGGKSQNAARVALILTGVVFQPGQQVLHSCDNPPCCNPRHLRAGSRSENSHDMHLRRGVTSSRRYFTPEQVQLIRRRLADGEQQTVIARDLGFTKAAVNAIARGKSWAWFDAPEPNVRKRAAA